MLVSDQWLMRVAQILVFHPKDMSFEWISKIKTISGILIGVVPRKEYTYDFLFQCCALPYGHMTYGEPIPYNERVMCGNSSHCSSRCIYHRSCSCYVLVMFHWIFGCISVLSNKFSWLARQQANKPPIQPNKVKLFVCLFFVYVHLLFVPL